MGRPRGTSAAPQAVLVSIVAVLLAYPLLSVVITAAGAGPAVVGRLLVAPGAARALSNTLWVSGAACFAAVLVSAGVVAATTGVGGRLASAVRAGVLLPLLVPPFAQAVGWSQAYGPGGITDALFHFPVRAVLGPAGVLVATAAEVMPIAYLVLAGAAAIHPDVLPVRAARASGSTRWDAYRRVTLPLMRPAAAAALALTFLAAVNNFTVAAVLGSPAGFETLTSRIYNDLNFATTSTAFVEAQVLAAGLAVVALLVLLPTGRLLDGGAANARTGQRGAPPRRGRPLALGAVCAYLALTTIGPLVGLILTALTRAPGLAPVPGNWTMVNFQQAFSGVRFLPALLNSVLLAVSSATLLVGLGLAAAMVHFRRGGRAIEGALLLGFALPGSVVAVAFLLTYGRWAGGSLLVILLAYCAKLWALAHRPISAALLGIPPDVSRAARASGAGRLDTIRTIVGPILAPALAAAWALVFLFALHEVTMSSLLYGPTSQTLAVLVLNIEQVGDVGSTAALACGLTGIVLAPAALLFAVSRRWPGRLT